MLRGPRRRRSLCEHVLQRPAPPARLLGAIREPGLRSGPPPPPPLETLIDWSLIFLTGWHPATKLWSGRDPWEGIERART